MNTFIRKLESFVALTAGDRTVLAQACSHTRRVAAHRDLIRAGEKPDDLYIILEGFACRSIVDASGKVSITSYLVPGDIADQHTFILKELDHTISTLSDCVIAVLRQEEFLKLVENHARIIRALWWSTLVDDATARAWLANIGARKGPKHVAHLLCELLMRLETVGLATRDGYLLPVTQAELGQTVGLSAVHINRVLRTLRERKLVTWDAAQRILIPEPQRLKAFCGFDDNYLHLSKASHGLRETA